jgi:sucrose phosphorylase
MEIRPRNAVTVLDTHDGIGIIDVGADASDRSRPGLLAPEQIDRLVETIHDNSGGTARRATGASNRDLYQVNCTFYDALGRDDARYLLARALQFWAPGLPQVYYVGLLAGSNDMDLLARSRVGRDVNRPYYTAEEIEVALHRPVVQQLCSLIRFRNTHPAFDGEFRISGGAGQLTLSWTAGDAVATLAADLTMAAATVQWTENGQTHEAALNQLP